MLATIIFLYNLSLQVTYVQVVFRSRHGQSWSETVCSICSHPCRTTRYNDGKHEVATHSGDNKDASPKSNTSNLVATITSQFTTDDLQQKRVRTREVNVLCGLQASAPINISINITYNSTSLKNSYGCGQSATQAV